MPGKWPLHAATATPVGRFGRRPTAATRESAPSRRPSWPPPQPPRATVGVSSWESGLEIEAQRIAGCRTHRRVGRALAPFRVAPDSHGAGQYARPPHRGRTKARHRPQHHHPENPGTGYRVKKPPFLRRSEGRPVQWNTVDPAPPVRRYRPLARGKGEATRSARSPSGVSLFHRLRWPSVQRVELEFPALVPEPRVDIRVARRACPARAAATWPCG
jgi:hypothetical protein